MYAICILGSACRDRNHATCVALPDYQRAWAAPQELPVLLLRHLRASSPRRRQEAAGSSLRPPVKQYGQLCVERTTMNIDGDLALARMLHREMNCRSTRGTPRSKQQTVPTLKIPARPSSDHTRTKRPRPGFESDGVQAAADSSSEMGSYVNEDSEGRGSATAHVSPAVPTLVDSANRPVPAFPWKWHGNDSSFPCLRNSTEGRQRLLWEAELIGSYVMLPCGCLHEQ